MPILIKKNFEQKMYFCLLKTRFFLKKGNPIFSIELRQRLPKSFSQLHVKNSRFFLSYFLKNDDWPKVYAGPRLTIFPYMYKLYKVIKFEKEKNAHSATSKCHVAEEFTSWWKRRWTFHRHMRNWGWWRS